MPKKTLAAVLAAAVLLPLLVFVDPPAADAHPKTKTVRRCAYDPFAGRQCWNETVSVRHYHTPVQRNLPEPCPAGTTGTPPNCLPIPSDNTNHVPTTTAAPPTTTTTEPPKCPPGWTGTPPNCQAPPPPCSWPKHSHGDTCHGPHVTPCGTGTWVAHAGHAPVQKPPCPTDPPQECPDGQHKHGICHADHGDPPCGTGTWYPHAGHPRVQRPACEKTVTHRAHCRMKEGEVATSDGKLKDANGNVLATCGQFVCSSSGKHLHDGQGTCHSLAVSHCIAGSHQHVHGSSPCHPIDTNGCAEGQHEHPHVNSRSNSPRNLACHPTGTVHYTLYWTRADTIVWEIVVCGPSNLIRNVLLGAAIGEGCSRVGEMTKEEQKKHIAQLNKLHNNKYGDKDDDEGTQPTPTPTTAAPTPTTAAPTPTTAPPPADPIPENPNTEQYLREYQRYSDAVRKHQRGEISAADRIAAAQRYKQVRCNRGDQSYC